MKEKIDLIFSNLKNECITEKQAHQQVLDLFDGIGSVSMKDLILYYQDAEKLDFTSKAFDVLNSMVNNR